MHNYTERLYIYAAFGVFCQYFGGYSHELGASEKTAAVLKKSTAVLKKTAAVFFKTAPVSNAYLSKTAQSPPSVSRQPSVSL